jgi:chromosome segregation ATPase
MSSNNEASAAVVRIRPSDFAERAAERAPGEIRLRAQALTAHRADLQREVDELLNQYKTVSDLFEECSATREQLQQIAAATEKEPATWCAAVVREANERLARLTDEANECYATLRSMQSSSSLAPQRLGRLERLLAAPSSTRTARQPLVTEYDEIF